MGGVGTEFDITYINDFADFYKEQVSELETTLLSVPLGKPADGEISSTFGYRRNPFSRRGSEFHSGIDFRGTTGDSIRATGSGIVTFSGYKGGYGRCVIIRHKENLCTLYGHLRALHVKEGETVESGQIIGLMGSSGRSTGTHLHYEVILDDKRVDPKFYIEIQENENHG